MSNLINQQLGKYRIQSLLAQGGMAEVYLAYEEQLQRQVVVKVMLAHLAKNDEFVARFQREALTTANLNHANIIPVYGTGTTEDGRPYLVMQYVRGGTLRDRIRQLARREELFTTITALTMVRYIADALRVAHDGGIVHRDLKPSNILLHPNGLPVLTDLGIAGLEAGSGLTQTGALIGTPHYMSPEQADGRSADARSDIYALGIILYELLAGNAPFRGERLEAIVYQHLNEPPPALGRVRPDLAVNTVELVYRCLEKKPENRYRSARELLAAIDQALAAEGDSSLSKMTDTGRQALFANLLRRSQVLRTITSTITERTHLPLWFLGVLLMAIAAVAVLLWPSAQPEAAAIMPPTFVVQADQPTASHEATAAAIVIISTSTPIPTQLPPTPTYPPLPTDTPTPTPDALLITAVPRPDQVVFQSNRDGDYEIYVMLPDGSNQRQLTDNGFADMFPAVSPDGSQILFQSQREGRWNIYVMDINGSNERQVINTGGDSRLPTFSPDGTRVAFLSNVYGNYNIFFVNPDGSNLFQVTSIEGGAGNMSWSPEGRLIYNSYNEDHEASWELYTSDLNGQNELRLTNNNTADWSAEYSPDGRFVTFLRNPDNDTKPDIFIMNADGTGQQPLFTSESYEWGPHWSADGRFIYFTRDVGTEAYLYRVGIDGSGETFLTAKGSYPSFAPGGLNTDPAAARFQPAGERIAYQCGNDRDSRIFLYNPATKSQTLLPNQPENSRVPAFSPNGTEISYRSNANDTWQIYASSIDGRFRRQLTPIFPNIDHTEATWSPDGERLAIVSSINGGLKQIVVISQEGSERQRLTVNDSASHDDPSWSVNGEIAFESNMNGYYKIFIVPAQGGPPQEIIAAGGASTTPAWSPDGEKIAFELLLDDQWHIWVANRDGSDPVQITTEGTDNQRPTWSPDGTQLAFYSNFEQSRPDQFDIWTIDLETQTPTQITSRGDCMDPAWGNVALRTIEP